MKGLWGWLWIICVGCGGTGSSPVGQGLGSSNGGELGRPSSTHLDLFDVLESGGAAFLALFRTNDEVGTVEQPRWNSTDGPRSTVMTFLEAMDHVSVGREAAWPRAEKTLAEVEGVSPREAASDLLEVFDRLPSISALVLPDEARVQEDGIRRYELFPRGVEVEWLYLALGKEPEGRIILVSDGDGWRFSASTVEGARRLARSVRSIPPRPRMRRSEDLFASVVGVTFVETSAPGWLWFGCGLALTALVAYGAGRGLTRLAHAIEERGDLILPEPIRSLQLPLILVIVVFGMLAASATLKLDPSVEAFRWTLIETLMTLAVIWLIVPLVELGVVGARRTVTGDQDRYGRMMATTIRRSLRLAAIILLTLFAAQNLLSWDLTALLGGLGLIALALSLAAQEAVKNFFGGITIFANRQFFVGDWIVFDERWGMVEDVDLQVTRIRLLEGELWNVPNMKFVNEPVHNLSERLYIRRVMLLDLPYELPTDDIARALSILEQVLSSEPVCRDGRCDLEERPPQVNFLGFESSSLRIRVDYWYLLHPSGTLPQRESDGGWLTYLDHCSTVNLLVHARMKEAGISFTFPVERLKLQGADGGPIELRWSDDGGSPVVARAPVSDRANVG